MLVVISDLHLVDGTAGGNNLHLRAFEQVFLCDIQSLVTDNKAEEVKIVLLGDTIDLLRSAKWFKDGFPEADRPWGQNGLDDLNKLELPRGYNSSSNMSNTEHKCMEILLEIIKQNYKIFKFFRNIKRVFPTVKENKVELIYVPGNHDRLVNCYPSLRKKVAQVLGLTIGGTAVTTGRNRNWDWCFLDHFNAEKYGVFAHHGHKYDKWNYGGSHDEVPIGDVITTEIVARIPRVFCDEMKTGLLDMDFAGPEDRLATEEKIDAEIAVLTEEIDNIRPWTSIFLYLRRKSRKFKNFEKHGQGYSQALNRTLCKVFSDFWKIPFVKNWTKQPHNLGIVCCGLLEVAGEWIASWRGLVPDPYKDRYAKDAQRDHNESKQSNNAPFVLYGHTHTPVQVPLCHDRTKSDPDSIYINTGTWRPRIIQTADGQEYVNLKTMTFVVFYGPEEDCLDKKDGTRSFDVWTGWQSKQCRDAACLLSMASGRATF